MESEAAFKRHVLWEAFLFGNQSVFNEKCFIGSKVDFLNEWDY